MLAGHLHIEGGGFGEPIAAHAPVRGGHFLDEAEYCDRIGIVFRGRMIALGTPDEIKAQAGTESLEDAFIALVEAAP